jgi:3-hydroxyacyl-[acyl-carrier-protein] dehydratase
MLDTRALLDVLPHRPPMLMIDRVLSLVPRREAHAEKDIGEDDPWVAGHFPGHPVFPGVLVIEAMAQTACVLAAHSVQRSDGKRLPYLVGIDQTRFRRAVRPGDCLALHVRCTKTWGPFWQLEARASVGGELAAQARLMATLVDAADATADRFDNPPRATPAASRACTEDLR